MANAFDNIESSYIEDNYDKDLSSPTPKFGTKAIEILDSLFVIVTKPFVLTVLCILSVLIYLLAKYYSIEHSDIEWIKAFVEDMKAYLSCLFSSVITFAITECFEHSKK